ncbi:7292_t:CDS:2 [Gigaspora rosea]|nr:7292_t:CDS:2 [Gigaspora rosea]
MATKLITTESEFEERIDESTNINEITKNSGIFHHYETFEVFEVIGNGSRGIIQKAMSITYQKIVVLKEISQSQNYSLRELINDVQKYQKIDSHDNILKLFGLTTIKVLSIKNSQNEKKIKLKIDSKGIQDLIQTYQEEYDNKAKELEILGTFLKTLKQPDNVLNPFSTSIIMNQSKLIFDKIQNTIGELTASSISEKLSENSANIPSLSSNLEKNFNNFNESPSDKLSSFKFILDLFQYFFKYFDTYEQHNAIGPMLINYFQNNNKNPTTILNHLINHKHHLYFTGIIGFCFLYGIGTTINHKKAIEMYTRATELKDTFGNL